MHVYHRILRNGIGARTIQDVYYKCRDGQGEDFCDELGYCVNLRVAASVKRQRHFRH